MSDECLATPSLQPLCERLRAELPDITCPCRQSGHDWKWLACCEQQSIDGHHLKCGK